MTKLALRKSDEKEIDEDEQLLIIGQSGIGKTHAIERTIYSYWKEGFDILICSDVKGLMELGFMCFPDTIMKQYHRKRLNIQDNKPESVSIRILHPFTFEIPNIKIPETRFFSFPILSIDDSAFNLLIETSEDKSTRELLISARDSLKENEDLWSFMFNLSHLIERKTQLEGSYEFRMPDPENFALSGVSLGTIKNLDELVRIFNRFQRHMFLQESNSTLSLDWKKEIFSDTSIKIFSTRYIKDQKTKDFFVLMLLNQLVEHAHLSKKGILVVLDEIKDICPSDSTVQYSRILSNQIARHLNTNFRARKINSLSTSQSLAGLSKSLLRSNSFTKIIVMKISGETDLDTLRKVYGYNNDDIQFILDLERNQFYIIGGGLGVENEIPLRFCFSPFPHCEAGYKFDKFYEKFFPEKMINYSSLKRQMNEKKQKSINYFMQIARNKVKRRIEARRKIQEEKTKSENIKEELQKIKQEKVSEKRIELEKRNLDILKDSEAGLSQSKIAQKYKISQPMVFNILRKLKEVDNDSS
ncbi:hypothetical protein HYX17_02510 [Candidatus Woesearchaeota archaeon]|nr:hypothetical protein [Candidatus Woesearchaeota archaeon]